MPLSGDPDYTPVAPNYSTAPPATGRKPTSGGLVTPTGIAQRLPPPPLVSVLTSNPWWLRSVPPALFLNPPPIDGGSGGGGGSSSGDNQSGATSSEVAASPLWYDLPGFRDQDSAFGNWADLNPVQPIAALGLDVNRPSASLFVRVLEGHEIIPSSEARTPRGFTLQAGLTDSFRSSFLASDSGGMHDSRGDGPLRGYRDIKYQFGGHIPAPGQQPGNPDTGKQAPSGQGLAEPGHATDMPGTPGAGQPTQADRLPTKPKPGSHTHAPRKPPVSVGASKSYPIGRQHSIVVFGSKLTVKISEKATVTFSASAGRGPVAVTLNKGNRSISVSHGEISFHDRGRANLWARRTRTDQAAVIEALVTHQPQKLGHVGLDLSVRVAGREQHIPGGDLGIEVKAKLEKGVPVLEIASSLTFKVKTPGHGEVAVTLSDVTKIELHGRVNVNDPAAVAKVVAELGGVLILVGVARATASRLPSWEPLPDTSRT